MPKSRRSRGGPRQLRDPLTRIVKPPSDPRLAALRQDKVLPVVEDLSSSDTKKRSAAAIAAASLAQDPECRRLLLREQIVHRLSNRSITDVALETRAAAWGIFQLLAKEQGDDFCLHLLRQDILTSMDDAARVTLHKLRSNFDSLPKAEKSFVISIAASLISLATTLAEACVDAMNAIVAAIAENDSIAKLLGLAVRHPSPIANLRADALAGLMMLSEDNQQFSKEFARCPHFRSVIALKDKEDAEGVLACALLHNIFVALDASTTGVRVMGVGDANLVPTLAKAISPPTSPDTVTGGGWSDPVKSQRLAIQVLASIGTAINNSPVEEPNPRYIGWLPRRAEDDDFDKPVSDADEVDMMNDLDRVTDSESNNGEDIVSVFKALVKTALPQLVRLSRLEPSGDNDADVRSLALSALSNIAWSASVIDLADRRNAAIRRVWVPGARFLWQQLISPLLATDMADLAFAAQVTGLAWALARVLSGKTPLKAGEHAKFMALYRASKDEPSPDSDPFQSLGTKCIGVLGHLARDPAPLEVNREIGLFLMSIISAAPKTPVTSAHLVEAFDQLFGIYANEQHACDRAVFWEENFFFQNPELGDRIAKTASSSIRFAAHKKKHAPLDWRLIRERAGQEAWRPSTSRKHLREKKESWLKPRR
ncbi:hypothetical protein L249_3678 [Ophiocordyceps polyrhachis-furcata BCC 54312]|uniref:SYO1-like TPR repeats domain-containing protein n=1 Tax=Ophiocordyceps polyrhachis-furcata BCC 54312 TaxID=1330021 RepID=A0A367L5G2_9HYPO|nr:hypothetical protein L249_3678 [Ophiocordyceps polyrhachis-furcata BCC 54312]